MGLFKTFLEMPLSRYEVAPFKKTNPTKDKEAMELADDHFNFRDRKAITNNIIKTKVEQILSKFPYNFNIIFLEDVFSFTGRSSPNYTIAVEKYCKENGIPIEGHITFAKNGSSGEPLTPWMILHTMGHAIMENSQRNEWYREIARILNTNYESHAIAHDRYGEVRTGGLDAVKFLSRFFKFSSAVNASKIKKNSVGSFSELVYELFAEYLWNGKIRWEVPNDESEHYNHLINVKPLHHLKNPNRFQQDMQSIERIFDNLLKSSVGKIIVDWFDG